MVHFTCSYYSAFKMIIIPQELLILVADFLPTTADVCNFRLSCRLFAMTGFPVLFQNVAILDTTEHISRFLSTLCNAPCKSLSATRHLTLQHGTWPIIWSYKTWLQHCLRVRRGHKSDELAFSHYMQFIIQEHHRNSLGNMHLEQLLQALPRLKSITLSHVNKWSWKPFNSLHYSELISRICTLPCWENVVIQPLSGILTLLDAFPQIRQLSVHGSLTAAPGTKQYPSILHLEVKSILGHCKNSDEIETFFSSFPNLTTVLISMETGGRLDEMTIRLNRLYWPNLHTCTLVNMLIEEDDLVSFIHRHSSLRSISLDRITLTSGSWDSFSCRYKRLRSSLYVQAM